MDYTSRGGRVILVISNIIPFKFLDSPDNLEILSVSLLGKKPFTICLIYIPPEASYHLSISNYLPSFNDSEKLIILGDFNFPDIDWPAYNSSNLYPHPFVTNHLTQLIDVPTHIGGSILDVVLTNTDAMYDISVNIKFPPSLSSHHFYDKLSIANIF